MADSPWPFVGRDLKAFQCGFLTSPFPVKQYCHTVTHVGFKIGAEPERLAVSVWVCVWFGP